MKKLLAVMLIVCLIIAVCPAARADGEFFVAIDDSLQPLSDSSMPRYYSGTLYAPYTLFTQNGLGISYSGSGSTDLISLYQGSTMLYFNLSEGYAFDTNLNTFDYSAVYSGGAMCVPVEFVCAFFGLSCSVISTDLAPILRIRTTTVSYSDSSFASVFRPLMQTLLDTHNAPSGGDAPQTGDNAGACVYMCFYELSGGSAPDILDTLDRFGCKVCFFLSVSDILENADAVRRIAGSGYTIGIYLTEGTGEEYDAASQALFDAARVKTVLISASASAYEYARALTESRRLILWDADQVYGSADTPSSSSISYRLPTTQSGEAALLLPCTEHFDGVLPNVFSYLVQNDYKLGVVNETTAPV